MNSHAKVCCKDIFLQTKTTHGSERKGFGDYMLQL